MQNNILKQLTALALCGFIFVSALIGIQVNVLAQDSLNSDYSGTNCPVGQISINNRCYCDPNKPTFKACIKNQLKDKPQSFVDAVLESAGDSYTPGGLLLNTASVNGMNYLDGKVTINKSTIYSGQDNGLLVENIRFKDAGGQLIAASLVQTNVVITTPSGRKITLKVIADLNGGFNIPLSPKSKGLIKQASIINPLGSINAQAADDAQYTLLSGNLQDLEQVGDHSAYITITNGGKLLNSQTVNWKVIKDPGVLGSAIDVLSRTGSNSSLLLAGIAIVMTALVTFFAVNRKEA